MSIIALCTALFSVTNRSSIANKLFHLVLESRINIIFVSRDSGIPIITIPGFGTDTIPGSRDPDPGIDIPSWKPASALASASGSRDFRVIVGFQPGFGFQTIKSCSGFGLGFEFVKY